MTAEDTQPNERLERSKGRRSVPIIHTSQSPKWHATRRTSRRGAPHRPGWQSRTPNQTRRSQTLDVSRDRLNRRQDAAVRSNHHVHTDLESLTLPSRKYDFQSDEQTFSGYSSSVNSRIPRASGRSEDSGSVSLCTNLPPPRMNGGVYPTKRQTRQWELSNGFSEKRTKMGLPKREEICVELPPECRKNAFRRSHFKSVFLAELCARLEQTVGVKIAQHRFTDTRLIITYSAPDVLRDEKPMLRDISGSAGRQYRIRPDSNSNFMDSTGDAFLLFNEDDSCNSSSSRPAKQPFEPIIINTPSGSNVKLEDLYKHVSALQGVEEGGCTSYTLSDRSRLEGREPCATEEDEGLATIIAQKGPMQCPRRFRSGVITLKYGSSSREAGVSPSAGEQGSLAPEVIEIDSTSPPSPGREGPDTVRNVAECYEEGLHTLCMDVEDESRTTKPESIDEQGQFLEEGSATVVQLPRTSGDKTRRILTSISSDLVYSVTMRGFVHEVDVQSMCHSRELYAPLDTDKDSVEDVSLFASPADSLAVVAQAYEENALSLLRLRDDVEGRRVTSIPRASVDRDRHRRGVSAVTTLPTSGSSLSFISAGYDHVIHLWSFDTNSSPDQPPVPKIIDIRHSSLIQSLLSVEDRLISGGADNSVRIWDLRAAQMVSTIRTSNSVYQLHRTESMETVLVEVAHRDMQFELHDLRLPPEVRLPVRFGYPTTQGIHGRYVRGAIDPYGWTTFVSGGRDGIVRLWDLRNLKRCKQEVVCFPGQKVVHAAFSQDSLIVASDDNQLLFLNLTRI